MDNFIKKFNEISIHDIPSVGGKNASLGEMFSKLSGIGVSVPDGFAITAFAFESFLSANSVRPLLLQCIASLDKKNFHNLNEVALLARNLILNAQLPDSIITSIIKAYEILSNGFPVTVAVRSSATAEDLPQASFAGQHESFLNISGNESLLLHVKKCFASLYTARAIKYREDNGYEHEKVSISVGVQRMVRSDLACSGLGFTLEPESGFRDIIHLSGVWGLGENIVQGTVTPDEYFIFKPTLIQNKNAIIQKKLGDKLLTMVYGTEGSNAVININTPIAKQNAFVLNDNEIIQIAKWSLIIERHYNKPMDIEWAKDGLNQQIYIIQARPETVHSQRNQLLVKEYKLSNKSTPIVTGEAVGSSVAIGKAKIIKSPTDCKSIAPDEIIVTEITSPDWDPLLKGALAIITDKGGRTSHASIVARELGVPAVVGCNNGTKVIKDGDIITVSCCEGRTGYVYQGKLDYEFKQHDFSGLRKPNFTEVLLIVEDPSKAFQLSFYPNDGVGLMRIEFVITHLIKIHPLALLNFDKITDNSLKAEIEELTHHYPNKAQYFIDKLAEGIASISAAFYPKQVIVRMSDFKSNEYRNLIGGLAYESVEENPMIGFRGASRYYNSSYKDGFRLECEAVKKVRDEMGFTNVKVMIPFCRTIEEGRKVISVMNEFGLKQHVNDLEIYVMAEIPSNVILAEKFAKIFDGFSIGSNDLTQLVLGIDRDSSIISGLFDEQNEAVKEMISEMIKKAKKSGTKIGLCGQAPSDFTDFAKFLVSEGIDSISFNADAILKGIENIKKAELN